MQLVQSHRFTVRQTVGPVSTALRTRSPPPMRSFARFSAYAAVAAVLLAGGLFSLIGSQFGKQSDLSQLLFESRRSEAIRLRDEMVLYNHEVKRTIVADIIAGRLSLREAAVRFQEANSLVENNDPDLVA